MLADDHPDTAGSYNNVAANLDAQGKYDLAQPQLEKALEILRRLADDHPEPSQLQQPGTTSMPRGSMTWPSRTTSSRWRSVSAGSPTTILTRPSATTTWRSTSPPKGSTREPSRCTRRRGDSSADASPTTTRAPPPAYSALAYNLASQGKYHEARDRWLSAVKSLDKARLRIAFAGLDRAGTVQSPRAALAAVLARLGQPAEAWQTLEEDLGRGLLDELAAREDRRLSPAERDRLRELTTELDRLDRLVETTPEGTRPGRAGEAVRGLEAPSASWRALPWVNCRPSSPGNTASWRARSPG